MNESNHFTHTNFEKIKKLIWKIIKIDYTEKITMLETINF